jgi:hypothetical protein
MLLSFLMPGRYQSSFSLSIWESLFLSAAAIAAAEPVTTLLLVILQHEAV